VRDIFLFGISFKVFLRKFYIFLMILKKRRIPIFVDTNSKPVFCNPQIAYKFFWSSENDIIFTSKSKIEFFERVVKTLRRRRKEYLIQKPAILIRAVKSGRTSPKNLFM